jgi:acetyl-CoA carboxylase carboxyltransferase component
MTREKNQSDDDPHKLNQLKSRKNRALEMGGADKINRQHQAGRLTARERIAYLIDDGTFSEKGLLAHSDRLEDQDSTPADGKVTGYGEIDGRSVHIGADDVTTKAGAYGRIGSSKAHKEVAYAIKKGYPIINLGDAGGGRIPDVMGSVGIMNIGLPTDNPPRDRKVPYIATIMGDCFGGPSFYAATADIVVQVKGAIMAVTGAPVLEAATGEKVTPEELGGWELHSKKTGLVDLFATDDQHCLALVKKTLSYLPSNYQQLPPYVTPDDSKDRRIPKICEMVPASPRRGYDMRRILEQIFDCQSLLELKPHYDRSLITSFARLDGHVIGVVANNPMFNAGAMGWGACEKATSFIALCDSFHIPLIFLHDTPGFFVSKAAEENKMPLRIMQFFEALHHATVPKIALILRKSYGMAHFNMLGGNMNADSLLAWPTADISFMAPEVAVNVVYGRKIETSENPQKERQSLLEQMKEANEPWLPAGLNEIDDIIEPADTRIELIRTLVHSFGANPEYRKSKRLMASWPTMF